MKQPGRPSAIALATVSALPTRMLEPPADLSEEQALVWVSVVATKPIEWWDAGSTPLLAQYCRATVESVRVGEMVDAVSRRLVHGDNCLGDYKELRKIQAGLSAELTSLATKMRLSQQSRYQAKSANTANDKAHGRRPWQRHSDADS